MEPTLPGPWASAGEIAIGFSTIMCLPARAASVAILACIWWGVVMTTPSMFDWASSSR